MSEKDQLKAHKKTSTFWDGSFKILTCGFLVLPDKLDGFYGLVFNWNYFSKALNSKKIEVD